MEFDFFFTLTVATEEDARRIDEKVAALAGSLAHLSVLADSLDRRPIEYRFTGRVSVPTLDLTHAREEVISLLTPHFRWQGRTFEWPPRDLQVSVAHPPLHGNWLFEDFAIELQNWLLTRVMRFSATGLEDRFDLLFEDDDQRRWLYELRSWKPREENWRFVAGGLTQWLDLVAKTRKLTAIPKVSEVAPPEPGEVVSFDLVPMH